MDFAEKQLAKYGWVKGQGLGKQKTGISEAIKVKLKRDSSGVGCVPGAEFSSNWWEKAFKSAANNIKVKENKEGEVVIESSGKDSSISLKRKHYDAHRSDLMHGGFLDFTCTEHRHGDGSVVVVTSKHLKRQRKAEECRKDDEEGVEDEEMGGKMDDSLFKACGGRTAHKGARHGLTLSGKLARIQRQEEDEVAMATHLEGQKLQDSSKIEGQIGQIHKKQKLSSMAPGEEVGEVDQVSKRTRKKKRKQHKRLD